MPSVPGISFQYMLTTAISEINMEWIITELSDHLLIPLFTGMRSVTLSLIRTILLVFHLYTDYQPSLVLRIILHSTNLQVCFSGF